MPKQITAKNTCLFATGSVPTAAEVITTNKDVLIIPKPLVVQYDDKGSGNTGTKKTQTIADGTTADFKIEVNAKGSGGAGVVPKVAELLKACKLSETVNAGTSVIYAPSETILNATAKHYLDGNMREITGIAGDFTFGGKIGEIVKFNFSFKGFTTLEESVEANPSVTLDTNTNLVIESITAMTIGGASIKLSSFEFTKGNDVQKTYACNEKVFEVVDHKPTVKVTAVKTNGNDDHWNDLKSNTRKSLEVVLGSGDGKKLTFTAPYCNPSDVSESDSSGKIIFERTWLCESSVGNDHFSLVYS